MADIATTQAMAEGLSKYNLYWVAGLSWTVSLGLFLWLMRVSSLRIHDRDRFESKLEALTEKLALHMDRSTEAATLLLDKSRRPSGVRTRSGDVPTLGAESVSEVKKVGP